MKRFIKIILISGLIFNAGIQTSNAVNYTSHFPLIKSTYHINKSFDVIPNDKKGNKKVVLITIDDGPTKRAPEIMNIMMKHNVKAIFFINGMNNKTAPGIIEQEAKNGFTIGNHTWSHLNLKKERNIDKIKREIDDNTKLITNITGSSPKFFRPPYGASSTYVRELISKDNMIFMNWSGSALDWEKNAKDEKVFLKNVLGSIHDGEIILLHEHPWTVKYLDTLITEIKQKGYTILDPNQITE
jgi:peptidoglycan/xylan/chitin deacetylase (PgdA/CDA1 family)